MISAGRMKSYGRRESRVARAMPGIGSGDEKELRYE